MGIRTMDTFLTLRDTSGNFTPTFHLDPNMVTHWILVEVLCQKLGFSFWIIGLGSDLGLGLINLRIGIVHGIIVKYFLSQ